MSYTPEETRRQRSGSARHFNRADRDLSAHDFKKRNALIVVPLRLTEELCDRLHLLDEGTKDLEGSEDWHR